MEKLWKACVSHLAYDLDEWALMLAETASEAAVAYAQRWHIENDYSPVLDVLVRLEDGGEIERFRVVAEQVTTFTATPMSEAA